MKLFRFPCRLSNESFEFTETELCPCLSSWPSLSARLSEPSVLTVKGEALVSSSTFIFLFPPVLCPFPHRPSVGRSFCLRSTFQHDTSGMKCEVFYWICTVRLSIIWSEWTWFIIFFMKQHHLLSWRRYQESCGLSPAATSQRHQFLLPNLKSTVQAHRHNRCEICFMAEEAPAQKYHQLSCSLSSDDLSHFCGAWRSSILWPLHTCLPVHALDSAFGSF